MPGGLMQLVNTSGAQNNYLFVNPQISFFKVVYRRHSNFAIQNIVEIPDFYNLQFDEETTINFKIPRNGDLLSKLYFTFDLPDVYSGKASSANSSKFNFKWIKNIGANIIKDIQLKIGGVEIEKIHGEWLVLNNELNHDSEQKKQFNELIGNTKDVFDPADGAGQGVNQNLDNFYNYPHITGSSNNTGTSTQQSTRWASDDVIAYNVIDTDITFPSIHGRKIRVPINFFFTKNSGLALPLVALQYHEVQITLTLRKLRELYTILDTTDGGATEGKRIKPTTSDSENKLDKFVTRVTGDNELNINPQFDLKYIFLDDEERKRFAKFEHEYLIERPKQMEKIDISDGTYTQMINSSSPVKYMIFVNQRSDAKDRNDWNNYTNWLYEETPPYSREYKNMEVYYNNIRSTYPYYAYNSGQSFSDGQTHNAQFKKSYLKQNIITQSVLKFDGMDRFDVTPNDYFEKVESHDYFKGSVKPGVNVYSFSLDPEEFQPSGACNFANVNKVEIENTYNIPYETTLGNGGYKFDQRVYLVEYNILKITSGMASLAFVS
jgi:hypothetical protein